MQNPEMDYWNEKPGKLLIDERLTTMTPEELTAWFWLRQRARTQNPPGILPNDEAKLQKWSGLTAKKWKEASGAVLALFERDFELRYHEPEIKTAYLEFCLFQHEKSVEMKRRGNARWKKKDPDPKFVNPYANFKMHKDAQALHEQSTSNTKNVDINAKSHSDAQALHEQSHSMHKHSNILTNLLVSIKGDGPPPTEGTASTHQPPLSPPTPPPRTDAAGNRTKFLAELDAIKARDNREKPPDAPPPPTPSTSESVLAEAGAT